MGTGTNPGLSLSPRFTPPAATTCASSAASLRWSARVAQGHCGGGMASMCSRLHLSQPSSSWPMSRWGHRQAPVAAGGQAEKKTMAEISDGASMSVCFDFRRSRGSLVLTRRCWGSTSGSWLVLWLEPLHRAASTPWRWGWRLGVQPRRAHDLGQGWEDVGRTPALWYLNNEFSEVIPSSTACRTLAVGPDSRASKNDFVCSLLSCRSSCYLFLSSRFWKHGWL